MGWVEPISLFLTVCLPSRTLLGDLGSLEWRPLRALPREVSSAFWEVFPWEAILSLTSSLLLTWGWNQVPCIVGKGSYSSVWADSCQFPAEAPEGQGQGPQAAREHRKAGHERRGPAEVRVLCEGLGAGGRAGLDTG